MAIDTQAKRASVLGIVQPDGTIDQGDRQTLLGIYRGILAGLLVLHEEITELLVRWGGTHELDVVWQTAAVTRQVTWGGTHEYSVTWE